MKQIDLREIQYRVIVYPKGKLPIELISLCDSIRHTEEKGAFVAELSISMKNIKEPDHGWLHSSVKEHTPILLQALEGKSGKWTTLFNGLVYNWKTSASSHTIDLTAYDLLYPLMQSEEHFYFRKDMTLKQSIEMIAKDMGIKLEPIEGANEKLPKMVATSSIASTIKDRIDDHNKVSNTKYIVRANPLSNVAAMEVVAVGSNKVRYEITDWSIGESTHERSLEDLVTKVKIYGESKGENKDVRPPIKATHTRNTYYGVIQRIIKDSKSDDKQKATKEAKEILDEYSKVKETIRISRTADVPWVRKGDVINVATGTVGSYKNGVQYSIPLTVLSVIRDVGNRTMTLELER